VDAIVVLMRDHLDLGQLFREYRARTAAGSWTSEAHDRLRVALQRHARLEEDVLGPAIREAARRPGTEPLGTVETRSDLRELIQQLAALGNRDEPAEDGSRRASDLERRFRGHVRGQHSTLFPALRRALPAAELREIGRRMQQVKDDSGKTAPDALIESAAALARALAHAAQDVIAASCPSPRRRRAGGRPPGTARGADQADVERS
jgi:hypothetical protein